jgi:hypothetical protein
MPLNILFSNTFTPYGETSSFKPICNNTYTSQDISVDIATGWRLYGSIPGRGKGLFSSPKRPDRPWGPPNLLSSGYWIKRPECDADHSPIAELKNSEAISPLLPNFSWRGARSTLPLHYIYIYKLIRHTNIPNNHVIAMCLEAEKAKSIQRLLRILWQGVEVQVPIGSRMFTSSYRPDPLWGPPNLLSNGYQGFLVWV